MLANWTEVTPRFRLKNDLSYRTSAQDRGGLKGDASWEPKNRKRPNLLRFLVDFHLRWFVFVVLEDGLVRFHRAISYKLGELIAFCRQ